MSNSAALGPSTGVLHETGRLVKAPENFMTPDGIRQVFSEAKAGRRTFIRQAFAAAATAAGGGMLLTVAYE